VLGHHLLAGKRKHALWSDNAGNFKSAETMSVFSNHALNKLKEFGDFELYYLVASHGKTE
jgi:hypothetical protein